MRCLTSVNAALNYVNGGGKLMLVLLEVQVLWLASHADVSEHCLPPIGFLGDACCRAKVESKPDLSVRIALQEVFHFPAKKKLSWVAFILPPLRLARLSHGHYGHTQSPTHETNPFCG